MALANSETLGYLGDIFYVGGRMTPFLNAIGNPIGEDGNINPAAVRLVNSFEFAISQPVDTGVGSQPAITETQSVAGQTATTISRGQDANTVQIFQKTVEVSYKKESTPGTLYNAIAGVHNIDGVAAGMGFGYTNNPVQSEMDFQRMTNMKNMASQINYSCIQGSYQGAASAATAAKTRGLANAIVTNTEAAGSVYINTNLVNAVLKKMWDAGAPLLDVVALVGSFQRQRLAALYEFAPMSRTEGGVKIDTIYTDFATIGIICDPNMVTTSIFFVEMTICRLTVCPVKDQLVRVEPLAKSGASDKEQIYLQAGLDYGEESYHGSITGLLDS